MPDPTQYPLTVTSGTTLGNRTGTWRANRPVYVQHTSPCREACPAGAEIARWMDLLRGKEYRRAWEILTEDNPFPSSLGRICLHQCQSSCNRGSHDEPLEINALEQFLGDRALQEGWAFVPPVANRPQSVAVVGGGPAGLSCAYQLRRMGYPVTVFEARGKLGGNLVHALPEYQLPVQVIQREIQRILALGIAVRCGETVGKTVGWAELQAEFGAIFLAAGAPQIPGPGVPGQHLQGVANGLAFVQVAKTGRAQAPGTRVVVLGAGLTGMEAARTLRRLGVAVTIVTAESEDALLLPHRILEARQEGVQLIAGADVQALVGRDGAVTGVRLSGGLVPADAVIVATGRMVDLDSLPEESAVNSSLHIDARPFTRETNIPGLFAGGDVTGTRTAAEAVGGGKQAAAAIHAYLGQLDMEQAMAGSRLGYSPNLAMRHYLRPQSYAASGQVRHQRVITYADIEAMYFPKQPRIHRSWNPGSLLVESFAEVRQGLSEAQALEESRRCFSCGTCIGCDNCLLFCPDMAISRRADNEGFAVNWDYCKGCGACVQECPREALVLEEEVK